MFQVSLEAVESMVSRGEALDIYLAEVEMLRTRLDQLAWVKVCFIFSLVFIDLVYYPIYI